MARAARQRHLRFSLTPADNRRLASLCGHLDEHIKQIETRLKVHIANRGNVFKVSGDAEATQHAKELLLALYAATRNAALTPSNVNAALEKRRVSKKRGRGKREETVGDADDVGGANARDTVNRDPWAVDLLTPKAIITARTPRQTEYIQNILTHDISFGIGPAGTGKTFLAVACAVDALERSRVQRILLVRPAVEAGERLGFLPGDLGQKVDPYLRPLYDALHEMLGPERVARLMEKNVIELAPLAYMRGRTLNESFIILDEAQNTTLEQMKMFLTRIGFGATAVITGDITQVDLPRGQPSGLRQAIDVLRDIAGISFMHFTPEDVVRHPLVQRIVEAYDRYGDRYGERAERHNGRGGERAPAAATEPAAATTQGPADDKRDAGDRR